jgi:excisionase family DNA binding protein
MAEMSPKEIEGEIYLSTQEASDYLGVSRETLNQMTKDGRLAKYRQGFSRTVYYKRTELDDLKRIRRVDDDHDE